MKTAAEHQSLKTVKLLLLGESGSGKTGALASLVPHYKLTILDFDNGMDYLVREVKRSCPKHQKNLRYETFDEDYKLKAGNLVPEGSPKAYVKCLKVLDELKVQDWDDSQVLVLDSLTFFCSAVMLHTRHVSGNLAANRTYPADYGNAMNAISNFLAFIQSSRTNCHFIVISHLSYLEVVGHDTPTPTTRGLKPAETSEESKIWKAFPAALGKKLPPTVMTFFNSAILAKRSLSGKRILQTDGVKMIDLKSGSPDTPKELPLETGMKDLFEILLKKET